MRIWLPLLFCFGCEAASLGVNLPRGGTDSIRPENIKRDLWKLTDPRLGGRVPGSSGARLVAKQIAKRFEFSGLGPVFDGKFRQELGVDVGEMICGVHKGSGDQAVLMLALDPGIGTLSAIPMAAMINVAHAFETIEAPMHSMYFCVVPEAGGLTGFTNTTPVPLGQVVEIFIIGTLTGDTLVAQTGAVLGPLRTTLLHTGPLDWNVSDDIGQLNYAGISEQLDAVYLRVSSVD
jgi:hypothetical protein